MNQSQRTIAVVVFPGVTSLDAVGPLTVFDRLPEPYRAVVVGTRTELLATDGALLLQPQRTLAEVPEPFALLVAGGPGCVAAMADNAIQDYVRHSADTAELVTSVCTGSLVLAAAGLLEGRRATTHWAYAAELERLGAHYVRERWVEDGTFITAAGISAGIDMALVLAARLTDIATARRIQLSIEYDPQPPFGTLDWNEVGPSDLARQRQGGTGKELTRASEIFADRPDLLRKLVAS